MIAARDMNTSIDMPHFEAALDRIRSGIKKRKRLDDDEKLNAAYHDAAHAVTGWFLEGAMPPTKVRKFSDFRNLLISEFFEDFSDSSNTNIFLTLYNMPTFPIFTKNFSSASFPTRPAKSNVLKRKSIVWVV